ncbi:MAG: UDP-N-acetylglucosamine 1-carboxyvinyltransferase [Parcubacteria group bacterium RIFCSPLOWO2_01_FULL_48_18]|nr:MAG: UDP-N-acetylglucosamine 1-carboxyvinyltransferase [Parcubacteria group bacterium RIFCSPHIGHO2_02_FULL_48_10b]OHB21673.1 MAG: UDP-N-acetylglucosamine 1-carboxyvinyltransferase [Parcubacteria group bacterium RIFCSPLOWO2_01_FULL_48_18]
MQSFIINGGRKLEGEVTVQGSKNAALPIIAATLLTDRSCILQNVPRIGDVLVMLQILRQMGSRQRWLDEHTIEIVNDEIDPVKLNGQLASRIRASILLIGPLLARGDEVSVSFPGGDKIGARPLDAHLNAFRDAGVSVEYDGRRGRYHFKITGKPLREIVLKELSVTATENMVMFFSLTPQATKIHLAAAEPHVQDLGLFLKKIGVEISGLGTHSLVIKGKKRAVGRKGVLAPIVHRIISDYLAVGTFLVVGALAAKKLIIHDAQCDHLIATLQKLKEFGVRFECRGRELIVGAARTLKGANIQTLPYPGFPTDLQAPFGVLATQAQGESLIFDTLFENRLQYIDELKKMGARARVLDSHRASITGKTPLSGIEIRSLDIRAGATLVIAALIASGKSVIQGIEQIDRGYERLDEALQKLGADIKRI